MGTRISYEDTCELKSDKDVTVLAEVLDFSPKKYLSVTVNRSVKVNLKYVPDYDMYLGNMAGMELTTPGPKETVTYDSRRSR